MDFRRPRAANILQGLYLKNQVINKKFMIKYSKKRGNANLTFNRKSSNTLIKHRNITFIITV